MTRLLLELTAAPSCWQQNVLASVKVAVNEIERLRILEDRKYSLHKQEPAPEQLAAFERWFKSHVSTGKQLDQELAVAVAHAGDEEGNGLFAKSTIAKGAAFLTIPYSMILGSHLDVGPSVTPLAKRAAWQQVADDPLLKHFPSCMLALRLLGEACDGDASFFQPYIAILPTQFNVPLFYNVADFKYLEGTSLFEPAVKLLYNSIKQYCYFHALLARMKAQSPIPLDRFTVGNYFWALGVVLTRQNEVVVSESESETAMALIPGWDLCNHEPSDAISTFSDPLERVITCHAIRDFAAQEQVKMFYGKRSNEHLLLYSGFVQDGNEYDNVQLELALVDSDPLVKIKRMLIAKEADFVPIKEQGNLVYYRIDLSGGIVSPAMTRAVQVASMHKANLSAALRNAGVVGSKTLYHWDDDENQASLNAHRARCQRTRAQILRHTQVDPETAKHGALFQRYFQCQLDVLDAAIMNLNRVQC